MFLLSTKPNKYIIFTTLIVAKRVLRQSNVVLLFENLTLPKTLASDDLRYMIHKCINLLRCTKI